MNFLEAWQKAKHGQFIKNSLGATMEVFKDKSIHGIADTLVCGGDGRKEQRIFDEHVLADYELLPMEDEWGNPIKYKA